VNATGAWAAGVPGLEVRKRKGHLAITDRYPGYVRHQLVELGYMKSAHSTTEDSVAFNVQPRKTGQVLIGSSRQYGAEHTAIDPPVLGRMLQRALDYMPGLANLSTVRAWTGFRAATPDKVPLIGPSPETKRHYLATGHEGLGITTSLATGKLLADQLMHRTSDIPIEPYLPSRHHA
jgi:glycine/D-amino acid oxidase-like deaminating enzyme